MRKLTLQEQQWVEHAYPLVKLTMRNYGLSEHDIIDWHGELSIALCEAAIELKPHERQCLNDVVFRLEDRVHAILEAQQGQITEIPFGLKPHRTAVRGRNL